MSASLPAALEVCLSALRTGASLETCLALYPDLANELRPLLEAARAARLVPGPSTPAALARSRQRVMAHARRLQIRPAPRRAPSDLPRFAMGLAIAAVILFSGAGTLLAAARALPGDWLYPVKRTAESLRLDLAFRGRTRATLANDFDEQRRREVTTLLSLGRTEPVSFEGVVFRQEADLWLVADVPVRITAETRGAGGIRLGMTVEASGSTGPQGELLAEQITLREYDLAGIVASISETAWQIGGRSLIVDETTQADASIHLGDSVLARVRLGPDGTARARRIRLLAAATPPPTPPVSTPSMPTDEADDEIRFSGEVESIVGDIWTIAGIAVRVDSETEIDGQAGLGGRVEIRADRQNDGTLLATRIESVEGGVTPEGDRRETPAPVQSTTPEPGQGDEVEWEGMVNSIGASVWVIGGQTVQIDSGTEIDGDPAVGDTVRVRAIEVSGGLLAERIERRD